MSCAVRTHSDRGSHGRPASTDASRLPAAGGPRTRSRTFALRALRAQSSARALELSVAVHSHQDVADRGRRTARAQISFPRLWIGRG
jgi:hypothetical protein